MTFIIGYDIICQAIEMPDGAVMCRMGIIVYTMTIDIETFVLWD